MQYIKGITNDMLTAMLFKLLIRKESIVNERKGSDIV
jgi:hypothetical protein